MAEFWATRCCVSINLVLVTLYKIIPAGILFYKCMVKDRVYIFILLIFFLRFAFSLYCCFYFSPVLWFSYSFANLYFFKFYFVSCVSFLSCKYKDR